MDEARLTRWLLDGPAQQQSGPLAGAVAGWVGADGRAGYVYPEITGYFLQWLAWRAGRGDSSERLAPRAEAAQRWLAGWIGAATPPPTRVYPGPALADWRNDAVFTFDLAMVLRGLASAQRRGLIVADAALVERVCAWLARLVAADGRLDACVFHRAEAQRVARWSTRRGGFLAKAAAGILDAEGVLSGVPRVLADAARRTFDDSIAAMLAAPHQETHPFLYAIEGFLALPGHPRFAATLPAVAARFAELAARIDAAGAVPESALAVGQPRLDIVAQALRTGLLLAAHRDDVADSRPRRTTRLAEELAGNVGSGGALPFAAGALPPQWNVWTTMFAEQALALARCERDALVRFAAAPCIV